jgi:hypothetical protein
MEGLVREMQDPESGVPVRSQKQFLTSIPSAFMGECQRYLRCGVSVSGHHGQDTTVGCLRVAGYDLIEWLIERLAVDESGTESCIPHYHYLLPLPTITVIVVGYLLSAAALTLVCSLVSSLDVSDTLESARRSIRGYSLLPNDIFRFLATHFRPTFTFDTLARRYLAPPKSRLTRWHVELHTQDVCTECPFVEIEYKSSALPIVRSKLDDFFVGGNLRAIVVRWMESAISQSPIYFLTRAACFTWAIRDCERGR